jgi:hypothetical protein
MASSQTSERRSQILGLILLALFLICLPATAHSKNNRPWINEATASGLLGGDAMGEMRDATLPANRPFAPLRNLGRVSRAPSESQWSRLRVGTRLLLPPWCAVALIRRH